MKKSDTVHLNDSGSEILQKSGTVVSADITHSPVAVGSADLAKRMSRSIRAIVRSARRNAVSDPKELLFLIRFAIAQRQAARRRHTLERQNVHVPPFLIASITNRCNLFCKGCYARANQSCDETAKAELLPPKRWGELFAEADRLGVAFILLAGGEPMLNQPVLDQAAQVKRIIFPVFTNGTLFDESACQFFESNRNLIPIISLEGGHEDTDWRRGRGTYDRLQGTMQRLHRQKRLFGVSITVTTSNLRDVTERDFLEDLAHKGCQVFIFVEYVPVTADSLHLAPGDPERLWLAESIAAFRDRFPDVILLSFPGDEKNTGGCLAAGRGFFHINPTGGAEPCPFSPFSDTSLKTVSLRDALASPLFRRLNDEGLLLGEHSGGCLLFEMEADVKAMVGE